jgi:hypothetical protein
VHWVHACAARLSVPPAVCTLDTGCPCQKPITAEITPLRERIGAAYSVSGELGARIGLTRSLDIGAAAFFQLGIAADAKMNVMPPEAGLALAPRLAVGYAMRQNALMEMSSR